MNRIHLFLAIVFSAQCLSDYGQLPKTGEFHLKLGFNYLTSSENFASDGSLESINFQNQQVNFSANQFWIEPEIGIGERTALLIRSAVWNQNLNPTSGSASIASSSGIGDMDFAIKWGLSDFGALEMGLRLPPYERNVNISSLLPGDGSVDYRVAYHGLFLMGDWRYFLTPSFTVRSGGFPPNVGLQAAAQWNVTPAYFRAFAVSQLSIGYFQGDDTSSSVHNATGSGGSYLRLSGSSSGVELGIKSGLAISKGFYLEGTVSHSIIGRRYPSVLWAGLNIHGVMDLNPKAETIKVREVPFESAPQ